MGKRWIPVHLPAAYVGEQPPERLGLVDADHVYAVSPWGDTPFQGEHVPGCGIWVDGIGRVESDTPYEGVLMLLGITDG